MINNNQYIMEELPEEVIIRIGNLLSLDDLNNFKYITKYFYKTLKHLYCNEFYESLNPKDIPDEYELKGDEIRNVLDGNIIVKYENVNRWLTIMKLLEKDDHNRYLSIIREIRYNVDKYHNNRINFLKGLTAEQNQIKTTKFEINKVYAIQAFAGTGKTTTLVEIAKENKNEKILYLAFNNSLAKDARNKHFTFYEHVDVFTIHSLALNNVGDYEIKKLNVIDISEYLNIDYQDANIVKRILDNYFSSHRKRLCEDFVESQYNSPSKYVKLAESLWTSMRNMAYPMCHDGYLKLFMLKKVKLNYTIVLIDEAQDITPCMLKIILNMKDCAKIFVGDIHQQIYGFRNACNVFESIEFYETYYLTQSFRYGFGISHLANDILKTFKNETVSIKGLNKECEIVSNFNSNESYTYIFRSNKAMYESIFVCPYKFFIMGKTMKVEKELMKLEALNELMNTGSTNYEKLCNFENIFIAQTYFLSIYNVKWLTRITLLYQLGYLNYKNGLLNIQNNMVIDENDAKIIYGTCHQLKGLEYNNVKIANDFNIGISQDGLHLEISRKKTSIENYNLLYVAITRAKHKLCISNNINLLLNYIYKHKDREYISNLDSKIIDVCECNPQNNVRVYECQKKNVYRNRNFDEKMKKCKSCLSYASRRLINLRDIN